MTKIEQLDRFAEIAFAEIVKVSCEQIIQASEDARARITEGMGVLAYRLAHSAMEARKILVGDGLPVAEVQASLNLSNNQKLLLKAINEASPAEQQALGIIGSAISGQHQIVLGTLEASKSLRDKVISVGQKYGFSGISARVVFKTGHHTVEVSIGEAV